MMTISLSSVLASKGLPDQAQTIVKKYFIFSALMRGIFMLSSTFYFLFIVELVGISEAAFLITIGLLLQGLIDYPFGAIGDRIGQKKVIFLAYFIHSLAFASLLFVDSITFLIVIYMGEAVAKSLESGAINSWFDSNYKVTALKKDQNLEIYKASNFRIEMLIGFFASSMFLLGGIVAYWTVRELIFLIQAILMIVIGFVILISLNDIQTKNEKEQVSYLSLLSGGITLLLGNPRLLIFVLGSIIISAPIIIWVELILFIFYYGYTGSDASAGIFRFIVWFSSSLVVGVAGIYTKKLTARKSLYKMHLIHPFLFFISFALIITFFPLTGQFTIIALILSLIVFSLAGIIHYTSDILKKSVYLELVPNKQRNSFYSLIPTITMIVASPLIYIFGMIISSYGLNYSIVLLGLIEIVGAIIIGFSFYLPKTWGIQRQNQITQKYEKAVCC
ncbi:MAG: MFS transporter [Candidatus Hodarchaeales archaeon]